MNSSSLATQSLTVPQPAVQPPAVLPPGVALSVLPPPVVPLPALNEKVTISPLGLHIREPLTFEEWSALAGKIGSALRSMAFVIGDWLVYGEDHFDWDAKKGQTAGGSGGRRKVSAERNAQATSATGIDRAVLKNYAYVSRRVPMSLRNDRLSWDHHRVVAKLPPDEQKRWLAIATNPNDRLSARRLRVSVARGEVVSVESMGVPPSERGIANHIPWVNRLCAWWNQTGGPGWLKTRTPEQIAAILRDFQPVADIILTLETAKTARKMPR